MLHNHRPSRVRFIALLYNIIYNNLTSTSSSTMANRVKFSFLNNLKKTEMDLLAIVIDVCPELTPTDCNVGHGHGIISFDKSDAISELFTAEKVERLKELHLEPIPPRQYYTERTIFVTNIKPHVTKLPVQQLVADFNANNGSIKAEEIKDVTPTDSTKTTLKIILNDKEQVDQALIKGIRLRLVWIHPANITRQREDDIKQCYKCFKYEHYTNQCARTSPICSICSGDHHFRDCPNPNIKKCANCNGNHIAIARGCPTRKKELAQQLQNTNIPTPAQSMTQTTTPPDINSAKTFPPLPNKAVHPLPTTNYAHLNNTTPTTNPITQKPTNPYIEHEWGITLQVVQTFAEKASHGDPNIYLDIMNEFMVSKGLQPINLKRRPTSTPNVTNINPPPNTPQQQQPPRRTTTTDPTARLNNITTPPPPPRTQASPPTHSTPNTHNTTPQQEIIPPPTPIQSTCSTPTQSSMPKLRIQSSLDESDNTDTSTDASGSSESTEGSGSTEGSESTEDSESSREDNETTDSSTSETPAANDAPEDGTTSTPTDKEPAPSSGDEPTPSTTESASQEDDIIINIPSHQPIRVRYRRGPPSSKKRKLRSSKHHQQQS